MATYKVTAVASDWTQLTQGEVNGSYLVLKGEVFFQQSATKPTDTIKDAALSDYFNCESPKDAEPRAFFNVPDGEFIWVRTRDRLWTESDGDGSVVVHVTGGA